jgi:hypothetical protein
MPKDVVSLDIPSTPSNSGSRTCRGLLLRECHRSYSSLCLSAGSIRRTPSPSTTDSRRVNSNGCPWAISAIPQPDPICAVGAAPSPPRRGRRCAKVSAGRAYGACVQYPLPVWTKPRRGERGTGARPRFRIHHSRLRPVLYAPHRVPARIGAAPATPGPHSGPYRTATFRSATRNRTEPCTDHGFRSVTGEYRGPSSV